MSEVTYSGLSRVPSDYECADGQLALSLNLVPENGSLQPIFPPSLIFTLPDGYKVAYIHKTTAFTHYIITRADNSVQKGGDVYWLDSKEIPEDKNITKELLEKHELALAYEYLSTTEIKSIQAIGNTLIIVTNTDANYFLWKVSEEEDVENDAGEKVRPVADYLQLGTHLPEVSLSFGLQGKMVCEMDWDKTYYTEVSGTSLFFHYGFDIELEEAITEATKYDELTDENKTAVTEQVLAQVNRFVAENSTNAGHFIFPFFVRYAYRLYDGNITMHSAPILMLANTGCAPTVQVLGFSDNGKKASCIIMAMTHSLDYIVESDLGKEDEIRTTLKNWNDIIKSVDVFVSAPIYTYDQSGECQRFAPSETDEALCKPVDWLIKATNFGDNGKGTIKELTGDYGFNGYFIWSISHAYSEMIALHDQDQYRIAFGDSVELPQKEENDTKEEIQSCCNFYLLKAIKTEELAIGTVGSDAREVIDVEDDYLQSLLTREQMTDDYDSHDILIPNFMYNYNNRLDMANIVKKLYDGYPTNSMFCYANSLAEPITDEQEYITGWTDTPKSNGFQVYFYIRQDNKIIVRRNQAGLFSPMNESGRFLYLYYPNVNAYKAIIQNTDTGKAIEVKLAAHDFLNGAYYYEDWSNPTAETTDIANVSTGDDATVSVSNKIYTSEINNPFFFPVEQIVTVGTGTILGIATAAKPLSQGQFGSFPLYAFCDDGVWALSVNTEGIYSAVQPITRDVCINEKAITQLDSSVLFPTDRGIMQISGNAATCITDVLNGDNAYDITQLPHYEQLLRLAGITDEIAIKPIREFLETGVMLYDYTNQRIYVCSPDCNYAYVISTKSQEWGMAVVDISSVVNSYPDAYAMTDNGDFVDFSHPDDEGRQNTFLITRPMKLDAPNVLKTVTSTIQRGFFDKKHIQSVLWGSRDLLHWHTIRTSQSHEIRAIAGTPYKYFRIAVLAQLEKLESLFGATVQTTLRYNNKLR